MTVLNTTCSAGLLSRRAFSHLPRHTFGFRALAAGWRCGLFAELRAGDAKGILLNFGSPAFAVEKKLRSSTTSRSHAHASPADRPKNMIYQIRYLIAGITCSGEPA
jgi:hypothetical protein